jgi:hypothetical protein
VFQAVEVFICRLKPVDNDLEWTDAVILHLLYEVCVSACAISVWDFIWVGIREGGGVHGLIFNRCAIIALSLNDSSFRFMTCW